MTYTNEQLERTLVKLMPECLYFGVVNRRLWWQAHPKAGSVADPAQYLQLCWDAEEKLQYPNAGAYYDSLPSNHATWQERVVCLAKINKIEIE